MPIGKNQLIPILDGFEEYENMPAGIDLEFDQWWKGPIIRDGEGNTLSRRDVISTMRDQEAQHTDDNLKPVYGRLAYQGTLSIKGTELHVDRSDTNVTNLIVRQTTHELLRTIDLDYPKRYSIKKGERVHAMSFVEIFYTDKFNQVKNLHNYHGYKHQSLWTSSQKAADKWMQSNPYLFDFVPPAAIFVGEATPSSYHPDNLRIAFVNHFPYSPRIKTYFSVSKDGVVTVLTVVLKINKPN